MRVLETRLPETATHARNVAGYAEEIGHELGFVPSRIERLRLAGLLHDVGMLGLPDWVLDRGRGRFDGGARVRAQLRRHPELGADLLEGDGLEDVRAWVLMHHERPDGQGYPRGLPRHEIPLEASILAAADAYDAMTSERGHAPEEAIDELYACAGSQFDPEVVDAFVRALARTGVSAPPAATGRLHEARELVFT